MKNGSVFILFMSLSLFASSMSGRGLVLTEAQKDSVNNKLREITSIVESQGRTIQQLGTETEFGGKVFPEESRQLLESNLTSIRNIITRCDSIPVFKQKRDAGGQRTRRLRNEPAGRLHAPAPQRSSTNASLSLTHEQKTIWNNFVENAKRKWERSDNSQEIELLQFLEKVEQYLQGDQSVLQLLQSKLLDSNLTTFFNGTIGMYGGMTEPRINRPFIMKSIGGQMQKVYDDSKISKAWNLIKNSITDSQPR
jgi:hypothetical protein